MSNNPHYTASPQSHPHKLCLKPNTQAPLTPEPPKPKYLHHKGNQTQKQSTNSNPKKQLQTNSQQTTTQKIPTAQIELCGTMPTH